MATVTASSGVKLQASTGSLSGTTTLIGNNNGSSSTLAEIRAAGKPTKGGSAMVAGTSNGWSLSVTYKSDGTAVGSAAGEWAGVTMASVPVQVDAPGRTRHQTRGTKKPAKKATAKKKTTTKKASAKKKAVAKKKTARRTRR